MKKAQMEVIGLVIIVILILVGVLMFVRFVVLAPQSSQKTTIESLEANNLLSALLKTTICEISVLDAIKECQQATTICNQNACTYTEDKIQEIMEASLDVKTDYKIEVLTNNNPLFNLGSCERGINSAPYSIPSQGVTYTIKLKLCDKNP